MGRRIRWQLLVAGVSSALVLALIAYLALSATSVPRPVAGGQFVEVLSAPPLQLNPLVSDPAADPTGADIQALLFDGLMQIGPDGLPVPALAERPPEISDSGQVYTFTLRSGLNWHDGQPISSDDVVFTLRAVQNAAFAGDPRTGGVWRGALIDRLSGRQVRVQLRAPFAPLTALATFPILPAHLLRDLPPTQWASSPFSAKPVGSGPYRLTELTGQHALLSANPSYYGGRPLINTIELRFAANSREAWAAVADGSAQAYGASAGDSTRPASLPDRLVTNRALLDGYTVLTFNTRSGPLSDQRVRQALAAALDKDALLKQAADGVAVRLDTPLLPGTWAGQRQAPWYPLSPARANELLSAAGFSAERPLELALLVDSAPDRTAASAELVRQFAAVGVRVTLEPVSSAELLQRLQTHRFTMALHSWQRLGPDPDVYDLWHSSQATDGANYAGLTDQALDALLTEGRTASSRTARATVYEAFQPPLD